jgi:hypothetical protein
MRRASILSMSVAMTCALGATFASVSASATENKAEWAVNKGSGLEALKAGEAEALSETITTNKNWVIKQTAGAGITVECTKISFVGTFGESNIVGRKETVFVPLLFTGCKVTAPAGDKECEVESSGFPNGEIRTEAFGFMAAEGLEGPTSKPYVRFVPESSREEIATIKLIKPAGKTCTEASLEVDGILVAKIDTSKAAKAHKWEFGKNTGTRLTVGGEEATFTGAGEFVLKSGREWGDI